jgi:hypothetical protein
MKQLLSLLIGLTLIGGCAARDGETGPREPGEIRSQGFVEQWRAPLAMEGNEVMERGFLIDGTLYLYTSENRVFAIEASGGQLRYSNDVARATTRVRPPLVQANRVLFPTRSTLEIYSTAGRQLGSVPLGHSIRSPGVGSGNIVYVGLDYPIGGRVAKIDITRPYAHTVWELMTDGGLSAAPAMYEEIVYFGSEGGTVYAVNAARNPVWSTPGNVFRTDGPILADVKADETGVYVASTDTKLYCIDRLSGRIRWQYFAGSPLRDAPVLTDDTVYQFVQGKGLAALDKTTGAYTRQPRWVVRDARQLLSQDQTHAYVSMRDGSIAAVDRASGEVRFRSERRGFDVFVTNTRDAMVYVARRDGTVTAVRPVLSPGTVGYIVQANDLLLEPVTLAQ